LTDTAAQSASFTGNGINNKVFPDCIEPAPIDTFTAFAAALFINPGCLTTPEFESLFHGRMQEEMQIGSVDITVHHNLAFRQGGE
jgi:hypothetical protein